MKTKLKYFIIFFITFTITSCKRDLSYEKNFPVQEKYSDQKIIAIFSKVGEIHNKGLDSIFKNLQNVYGSTFTKSPNKLDHKKLYEIIDKRLLSFVTKELSARNIDLVTIINTSNTNNDIKGYLGKDLISEMKTLKQFDFLSKEFLTAMNTLNLLMDNNASKDEYEIWIQKNISKMSDLVEKIKLVSAGSIAYSSLNYWKENIYKWQSFLNHSKSSNEKTNLTARVEADPDPTKDGAGKKIGKADVVGVITGAVSGCVYGAIGGTAVVPGVGTIAGCAAIGGVWALTGGLGNSAKAAVESFIDWLVD